MGVAKITSTKSRLERDAKLAQNNHDVVTVIKILTYACFIFIFGIVAHTFKITGGTLDISFLGKNFSKGSNQA